MKHCNKKKNPPASACGKNCVILQTPDGAAYVATIAAGEYGGTMKASRKTVVDGVELWRCPMCGKSKPATEFNQRTRKSGAKVPGTYCKPCDREYLPPTYRAMLAQYPEELHARIIAFGSRKGE